MIEQVIPPEPGGSALTGWATVGGRYAAAPVGVVEWRRPGASGSARGDAPDLVLLHHPPLAGPSSELASRVEHYSLDPGATWWAADLRASGGCYRFRAYERGAFRGEIRLAIPGLDLVPLALAAAAVGARLGLSGAAIADRLGTFAGVPRDFERRGSYRGVTLVDDAALGQGGVAHPLGLARAMYGARTLRAVYLVGPGELPSPVEFAAADWMYLVARGEVAAESTRLLAASLRSSGASVACCPSLDAATEELDRHLDPGDVLVTLGAREVRTITDAFLRRLCRHPHHRRAARPADLVPPGRAGGLPRSPA